MHPTGHDTVTMFVGIDTEARTCILAYGYGQL